ncbi:major facilitator superfamily domain-containing protein [Schizophyllum fasciatum]
MLKNTTPPPIGLHWRCSSWFTTIVVGLGITTDLLVYSIIIPVLPFQLQELGYGGVSGLVGWLLFAYSAGLAAFTIPIAVLSERWGSRRWPLIVGLLILVGSQVMMMEAPNYWVMCIARVIQGFASSIVWVLGLALLCDCTPPSSVGRQLGFAMMGLALGSIVGPPVGGALYEKFGFRGPFIFGIGCSVADLVGRLVIIERKEAMRWGEVRADAPQGEEAEGVQASFTPAAATTADPVVRTPSNGSSHPPRQFSAMEVLHKLRRSPRAIATVFMTFVWGYVLPLSPVGAQEPTMPLHLEDVWGLSSGKVGLIYLAGVIPTLFSSPFSGWYTDRRGAEWAISWSLLLGLPWWAIITVDAHLALFIVSYCFENLFVSGVVSPLTAELAAVARDIEGVGYAHVYGAFNLAYGIGSSVMYDHLSKGWTAVCLLALGLSVLSLTLAICYTGEKPLGSRFLGVLRRKRQQNEANVAESNPAQ